MLWLAVILGIVEGLTEFIPVSSTGHLILFSKFLGLEGEAADAFLIFIQLGAILAALIVYRQNFLDLFSGLLSSKADCLASRFRNFILLAIACFPAALLGLIAHDYIEERLFNSISVAIALVLGGVALIFLDRKKLSEQDLVAETKLDDISYKQAFCVGLAQCLSLWPGVSRSGSTIIGGLFLGLNRKLAADFSFILAVPMITMASVYSLYKKWAVLSADQIPFFAVGFLVSLITGYLAIRFCLVILRRYSFRPFGWYRIVLGGIILLIALV